MREQFTAYEDSIDDKLETYVMEDLNLDPQKVQKHMDSLPLDTSFYTPSKSAPWKFFQYYVHSKMFNEAMDGYGRHDGDFSAYEPVVYWINKIHRDLHVPPVFITARGNHLKDIDINTEKMFNRYFPDIPHVEVDNTAGFWVRTTSSADKPKYMERVGAWLDDDYRNDVLHNFLMEKKIYVVKRKMPLNRILKCNDVIWSPRDPSQPALEELYDYIKTVKGTHSEIYKLGADADDTIRPFRYHMGPAVKLLRELEPELVESLQK